MPDFVFVTDADGVIKNITKDGKPYLKKVVLEQHYSIVRVYFKAANFSINQMSKSSENNIRRMFGMQSFIMCLTGLEAFANTFFLQRAIELNDEKIIERIKQSHGSLSKKLEELISRAFESQILDQEKIISRIFDYSQLRNEIVHPRWTPSSTKIDTPYPVMLDGMVENMQSIFEDQSFCLTALHWCLLFIARIGQHCGNVDPSGFIFYWTDNYEVSVQQLEKSIGLQSFQ